MNRKVALDLDGTLVSYGWDTADEPIINHALLQQLKAEGVEQIDICTNQAGIVFGYRSPESFAKVIDWLDRVAYNDYGIEIESLRISLYHNKADLKHIMTTSDDLARALSHSYVSSVYVWIDPASRKPNPTMLTLCGCTEYWGDSQEDEQAALAARVTYQKVERFTK